MDTLNIKVETKSAPERLAGLRRLTISNLIEVLKSDQSDIVRHEAAFILGERSEKATAYEFRLSHEALQTAVNNDMSVLVRHESALSLAYFPSEETIAVLCRACSDDYSEVRSSAFYAITQMILRKN